MTSQNSRKIDKSLHLYVITPKRRLKFFKAIILHAHVHGEKNYLSHSKLKKNHLPHMQFILKH